MAFSKAPLYREEAQLVGFYARAILHPERQMILEVLNKSGPLTVEELTKLSPLSQSAISRHLETLREADLVGFVEGFPYTHYNVKLENVIKMRNAINGFFDGFQI